MSAADKAARAVVNEALASAECIRNPKKRLSWDEYGLSLAKATAGRVACTRRRVGAVVMDECHRIIGTGYNGAPAGMPDCLEGACPRGRFGYDEVPAFADYDRPGTPGYCIAIHAEVNALNYLTRSAEGVTVYITDEPCAGCREYMHRAGVARVVWPGGEYVADSPR